MTPAQRKQMYAKNYPVWAGLSTLNVDAICGATPPGDRAACCTTCAPCRPGRSRRS